MTGTSIRGGGGAGGSGAIKAGLPGTPITGARTVGAAESAAATATNRANGMERCLLGLMLPRSRITSSVSAGQCDPLPNDGVPIRRARVPADRRRSPDNRCRNSHSTASHEVYRVLRQSQQDRGSRPSPCRRLQRCAAIDMVAIAATVPKVVRHLAPWQSGGQGRGQHPSRVCKYPVLAWRFAQTGERELRIALREFAGIGA